MGRIVTMAKLPALLVLLLPLLAASLPVQDKAADDEAATTTEPPIDVAAEAERPVDEDAMQSDEAAAEDDDEMRDRMAYLILSFWGRDLQGLEGLGGLDGGPYLAVDEGSDEGRGRQKRDVVFRPLWISKQRHAAKQRAAARYWTEYRRYQRYGRSVADADVEASATRRQRTPRAATPMSETELTAAGEADGQRSLSRVRRQWAFFPLFTSRMRQARDHGRRFGRDVSQVDEAQSEDDSRRRADGGAVLSRSRRQWPHRPLFATRQRAARVNRRRFQREAPVTPEQTMSRTRREWTDVPLFAAKQIEASRIKEEHDISHRRHHNHPEAPRDYRNYNPYNPYNPYNDYRPYRDYYRYNG